MESFYLLIGQATNNGVEDNVYLMIGNIPDGQRIINAVDEIKSLPSLPLLCRLTNKGFRMDV